MKIFTDERCTGYAMPGHPERPARISCSVARLKSQTDVTLTWAKPEPAPLEAVGRAHTQEHTEHIRTSQWDFDGDTPYYPEIYQHALRSAGGALAAMRSARDGHPALSLLRPPGHHATANRAMGFCYFNSMAIAALEARATGIERVAVYDFDVHHGNGTEAILLDQPGTAFFSIHQHPCYPGTGAHDRGKNCFNFPVAPGTPRDNYRALLEKALEKLSQFNPQLVGISAGFDAYARDPLAEGTLEAEDFQWLGSALRQLDIPLFCVLEGGYSDDLPDLILAFLKGLSPRSSP